MKFLLLVGLLAGLLEGNAQHRVLATALYSPRTNRALNLYQDSSFELDVLRFAHDVTWARPLHKGRYQQLGDTLYLFSGGGRIFRLQKQNFEVYAPIDLDSVRRDDSFLAWTIHYPNGEPRQSGGWTMEGTKEGVWQYFDSTGHAVNNKVFKNGILVDDDFKFHR